LNGWSGKILWLDLTNRKAWTEPTEPYVQKVIGGRGISVKIIFDRVNSEVGPYDPDNLLIFSPGVLAGTPAPSASRMQITTVLPDGLVASSGIGANIGAEIRHAGYDSIVVAGKSPALCYVTIADDRVEFCDVGNLAGSDTQATQRLIREKTGDHDSQIICIGPAGEHRVGAACIYTGLYSAAGHGGFGAIMGGKNLKAISVRGRRAIDIADMPGYLELCYEMRCQALDSPAWKANIAAGSVNNAASYVRGGMAAMGNFEEVLFDEESAREFERGAKDFRAKYAIGRIGCFGCPVHHFDVFNVPGIGVSAPKCQAWSRFAFPVWNKDYHLMFEASHLCNLYGLDFGSTSNIIAYLMHLHHEGIIGAADTDGIPMVRGDREAILAVIRKLAFQEGFGIKFRDGVREAARAFGPEAEKLALHVKGREMVLAEFRLLKSAALAHAVVKDEQDAVPIPEGLNLVSPAAASQMALRMTGDKDAANPETYEGKGLLTSQMEKRIIVVEMLGLCKHYLGFSTPFLDLPARLFSLATGVTVKEEDLMVAAHRVALLERSINVLRGLRVGDEMLPERIFGKPIPDGPHKGRLLDKVGFSKMVKEYYQENGYDGEGIPKEETFSKLGLGTEWQVFKQQMGQQ
jgi:aldehyde:ferredoxin oxidoreductase